MVRKMLGFTREATEQTQDMAVAVRQEFESFAVTFHEYYAAQVTPLIQRIDVLIQENENLRMMLESVTTEIVDIKSVMEQTSATVEEDKVTHYIGKKPKLLQSVSDEVAKMTYKEIRNLIKRACRYQKEEYSKFYAKLAQVSGKDVYAIGKTRLLPEENDFGAKDNNTTYINTVFKEGVHREAAAIALDMMRNK